MVNIMQSHFNKLSSTVNTLGVAVVIFLEVTVMFDLDISFHEGLR